MTNKIQVTVNIPDEEIVVEILENAIAEIIRKRIDALPVDDKVQIYDRILADLKDDFSSRR